MQLRSLVAGMTFTLLAVMLVGCGGPATTERETTPIVPKTIAFPDANLEAAVKGALGKPLSEEMSTAELATLTMLELENSGVANLSGLEYCTNLTELILWGHQASDLSPLSPLTSLTRLYLIGGSADKRGQIRDISPLSSLTNLRVLDIGYNQISDISPLSSLTNLTNLLLWENQISDLSPLSSLTNLIVLDLMLNDITDIHSLSSLANLEVLTLNDNRITDISPLVVNSGLGAGDSVYLWNNNLDLSEGSEDIENIRALEARGVEVVYKK